jgi:hypothetical protein
MRIAVALLCLAVAFRAHALQCSASSGPHTAALVELYTSAARTGLLERAQAADAALYLASFENRLVSRVAAGENAGRTLEHDYVVFEWVGPISFSDGRIAERRTLPLVPKAIPAHSGVAAFVQNRRSAEVLQALMLPACPG